MIDSIPENMGAIVIEQKGAPITFLSCPVPKPGAGEVLIRMAASPINPSDLATLLGTYRYQKPYPYIPGLEGSGTVIAVGSGLMARRLLGKRVACVSQPTSGGTWAEYMVTSATASIPLKHDVTLEQGAMMFVNPLTAIAFIDIAKQKHHKVIVNTAAASSLGRMLIRLGQQNGITVINIVRRKEHVDLLHSLGAEYVLDLNQPEFVSQLQTLTHRLNARLFFDAVTGRLTRQLLEAAPPGSTMVLYSRLAQDDCLIEPRQLIYENKRIIGFYLTDWLDKKNLLQKLLIADRIQSMLGNTLSTTVQQRFPLRSAMEALKAYVADMSAGKVLLIMEDGSISQ